MLHSCGISSRLDLRKSAPIGVRCDAGADSKCVGSVGVPTRMVRNLGIRNTWLPRPTRSDQYSIGPADVTFIANAMHSHGTAKTASKVRASRKSTHRFKRFLLYRYCSAKSFVYGHGRIPREQRARFPGIDSQGAAESLCHVVLTKHGGGCHKHRLWNRQ